jgi:hypothetical protein
MGMSEDEAKRLLKDKYPEPKKRKPKDGKHKNKSKPVHRPGRMNKTEAIYAERLSADRDVLYWKFEPLKFRIAKQTNYTPDFMAVTQNEIWIIEVKGGYEREDARLKWKTAAEMYPMFRWFIARYVKKQWHVEEYV